MEYYLSWNTKTVPQRIGSASDGSGLLFPGDIDQFQQVKLGTQKDAESSFRRNIKRLARRIASNRHVHVLKWIMGGNEWTPNKIKRISKVAADNLFKNLPNGPFRIDTLVNTGNGAKLVSNTFHLTLGNNHPLGPPKTLDDPQSLLQSAVEKFKDADYPKSLKRYYKYLKTSNKSPKQVATLENMYNGVYGILSQLHGLLVAAAETTPSPPLRKAMKVEMTGFVDKLQTIPGLVSVRSRLRFLSSKWSPKTAKKVALLINNQLKKMARAALPRGFKRMASKATTDVQ